MRISLLLIIIFVASCANERRGNYPALVFSKIESLPSKSESIEHEIKRVTKYENYFVKNYFDSDSSTLERFLRQQVRFGNDSVDIHFSFYVETKEVNINSIKLNPQLIYENEGELLIRRFSIQKNHLMIYYRNKKGEFKMRSEKL